MTRVQWNEMTKEQKLKYVAKLAKWKKKFIGWTSVGDDAEGRYSRRPNYLTDLNAIDKVVKEAIDKKGTAFLVTFYGKLERVLGSHSHSVYDMIMADAEQRAEAYVMAMEET